jgi:anti-sigma regulatory factor (Ser/Thr protein kinase)
MRQTRSFEHAAASVTAARRFATEALRGTHAETLEAIALMVSELATNCVRHSEGRFELTIMRTAREIRIEATDHGGGEPTMRSPGPTDPSGRGLRIVDVLAEAWGVEHRTGAATTVWFTVAAESSPEGDRQRASRRPGSQGSEKHIARSARRRSSAQMGNDDWCMRRHETSAGGLRRDEHLAHSVQVRGHADVARSGRGDAEQHRRR